MGFRIFKKGWNKFQYRSRVTPFAACLYKYEGQWEQDVSIPQQGYPLCGPLKRHRPLKRHLFQYRSRVTPFAAPGMMIVKEEEG